MAEPTLFERLKAVHEQIHGADHENPSQTLLIVEILEELSEKLDRLGDHSHTIS